VDFASPWPILGGFSHSFRLYVVVSHGENSTSDLPLKVKDVQSFSTLEEARETGEDLARRWQYPAIYKDDLGDYFVITKGEWPPRRSWPILKWDGEAWIPVLTKLDTLKRAVDASELFVLLGHNPVLVEFPGITFDIFLRESHVPGGAWIFSRTGTCCSVKYLTPPEVEEEEESISIQEIPL
jgi:hypothetical protein